MAERRRRPAHQTYISGNTVRVADPVRPAPDREVPKQQTSPRKRRAVSYRVRRNQEKALYVDLPYVLVLVAAVACVLYLCVTYLQIQSSITYRIHNIEALESRLEQLKAENDALETRIHTDIDLNHIYQVATEELGMVYANRDQVLLYDKTESEYVRQYEDIPEH